MRRSSMGVLRAGAIALAAAPFGAGATALLAAHGCTDERVNPLAVETAPTTPPPDASTPPDAGPPIRTVIQRNPFGNVAITDNLLWDGDFEWSSPFSDQYGWYQGQGSTATSLTISDVVVGPACKSGVKCARIKKGQSLLGNAVSSKDAGLDAWVHVRFEDPPGAAPSECSKARATLVDDGLFDDPPVKLVAPETPGADGWCRLAVVAPKRSGKVYLQVINAGGAPMLVDDAVIRRAATAEAGEQAFVVGGAPELQALTAEELADVEDARAILRAHRGPHDPPPNEARRRLDVWKNREGGVLAP